MKKVLTFALTIILTIGMATVVFANPGQNPNQNPGRPLLDVGGITITVTGGGNNLVIRAICNTTRESVVVPRTGNGTFNQLVSAFGYTYRIWVQGNSLRNAEQVSAPAPAPAPYVPTIVEEYEFYQFVGLNQVESIFTGTSEVEGSRAFVNGNAVVYDWYRGNNFPGVNGQAVRVGAIVTGTLTYNFVRNYIEQFVRVYEWVDVVVWSDGAREEVVRPGSEHVRGGVVDGEAYFTGPYDGSREINASGGHVILHQGFQGGLHERTADLTVGGVTVNFELLNTGNSPTNTIVRIIDHDVYAM